MANHYDNSGKDMKHDHMQRRKYISALSVSGLLGLCGCLSLRPANAQLGKVKISNQDDRPHSIQIQIKRNGDSVYESKFNVERSSKIGTQRNPAPVIMGKWPTKSGRFTVTARTDDQSDVSKIELTDDSCYGPILDIRKQADVAIYRGTLPESGCE